MLGEDIKGDYMRVYHYRRARLVSDTLRYLSSEEAQCIFDRYSEILGQIYPNHIIIVDDDKAYWITDGSIIEGQASDIVEGER